MPCLVVLYDGSRILNLDLDFLNRLWVRTGERHLWHWVVWASELGSATRYMLGIEWLETTCILA